MNEADAEFIHENTISESVNNHTGIVNQRLDLTLVVSWAPSVAAHGIVWRLGGAMRDLAQSNGTFAGAVFEFGFVCKNMELLEFWNSSFLYFYIFRSVRTVII